MIVQEEGIPIVTFSGVLVDLEKDEEEFWFLAYGKKVAVSMLLYYKCYQFDLKKRVVVNFRERYNYNTISWVVITQSEYTPEFLKGNHYLIENLVTGEVYRTETISEACIYFGVKKFQLYENIFKGKLRNGCKVKKVVGAGVSNSLYDVELSDDSLDPEVINLDSDEDVVDLNVY